MTELLLTTDRGNRALIFIFNSTAYHQRLAQHGWRQQFVQIPPWDSHQEDGPILHFCQEQKSMWDSLQKSLSNLRWPFALRRSQSESSSESQLCPRWCQRCHCCGCRRWCHLHHHGSCIGMIECCQSLYLSIPNNKWWRSREKSCHFWCKTWADPSSMGTQKRQWEFPEYFKVPISSIFFIFLSDSLYHLMNFCERKIRCG